MKKKNKTLPFIGNYLHKIDNKGRVSLPASFRHNLETDRLIVIEWPDFLNKNENNFFYLIEESSIEKFLKEKSVYLEDVSDFTEETFIDNQGRITLKSKSISKKNIKFSGCGHFIKCSQN